jgi:hypothetical protein
MNNSIAKASHYLEDTGLIYIPEIDKTGIHVRGLSTLIGCHPQTINNLLESRQGNQVLEAEIQTVTGLKTVKFILEDEVIEVLEAIALAPKVKIETKQHAMALYRKFALAGFKLYAMMQVAPERLGMSAAPREEAPVMAEGLMGFTWKQLRDLWVYKEALRVGLMPGAEVERAIHPDLLCATTEVAMYAFFKKDLIDKEEAQAFHRLAREIWLKGKDAEEDEEQDLADLVEARESVEKLEVAGYHLALQAFDSVYSSFRCDRQLALRG